MLIVSHSVDCQIQNVFTSVFWYFAGLQHWNNVTPYFCALLVKLNVTVRVIQQAVSELCSLGRFKNLKFFHYLGGKHIGHVIASGDFILQLFTN
jgi:hypothetical protein